MQPPRYPISTLVIIALLAVLYYLVFGIQMPIPIPQP